MESNKFAPSPACSVLFSGESALPLIFLEDSQLGWKIPPWSTLGSQAESCWAQVLSVSKFKLVLETPAALGATVCTVFLSI